MQTYQHHAEPVAAADEPAARELIRQAFESTYRWNPAFKGFAAGLRIQDAGQVAEGSVTVALPETVTVTLPDADVQKWAEGQIGMMAVHRGPRSFEQSDGRHVLTLGPEDHHPFGRLVLIHGDGMNSRYRILDRHIRQINRSMGPVRFTINVEEALQTPDGTHLTTRYTVYYFHPQDGALKQVDSITDQHTVIEGTYLPGLRRVISAVDGDVRVRLMELTGHRLL